MLSGHFVYDKILESKITILIEYLEVDKNGENRSEKQEKEESENLSKAENKIQYSSRTRCTFHGGCIFRYIVLPTVDDDLKL